MTHTAVQLLPHPPTSRVTQKRMHTTLSKPWTFPSLPMTIQPKQGIKLFGAEDGTGEGELHSKTSNGAARFWIPPVQWLNPILHLGKSQHPTQFSSARWLYFTSWNPLLSYRCHPVKILWWENSADSRYQGWSSCPLPGIRRGSGQQTTHTSTPTISLCQRLVSDPNPHQPLHPPKAVEQAPEAVGMPDPSALCKKPTPKVLLTQTAVRRASNTVPYCDTTSGLFTPLLDLQHPVKGDSASPVAQGLMELRWSLNVHSHTEGNRFELEGLCGSLALNVKCTVTLNLFQLKAKCLSSPLKTHGCQNICWSDKLQKQRPHSDCREESHCCKPAPGKCSIPTYKTEHHPKVKRK